MSQSDSEHVLTEREKCFIEEYLVDLNGRRAAIRAGYSEHSAASIASENLTKPHISDAVSKAMLARSKRTRSKADRVIRELERIAYADMDDYTRVDSDGKLTLIPANERKKGASRAIKKISQTESSSSGETNSESLTQSLDLHDKIRALELLGKHLGVFARYDKGEAESEDEPEKKPIKPQYSPSDPEKGAV